MHNRSHRGKDFRARKESLNTEDFTPRSTSQRSVGSVEHIVLTWTREGFWEIYKTGQGHINRKLKSSTSNVPNAIVGQNWWWRKIGLSISRHGFIADRFCIMRHLQWNKGIYEQKTARDLRLHGGTMFFLGNRKISNKLDDFQRDGMLFSWPVYSIHDLVKYNEHVDLW